MKLRSSYCSQETNGQRVTLFVLSEGFRLQHQAALIDLVLPQDCIEVRSIRFKDGLHPFAS